MNFVHSSFGRFSVAVAAAACLVLTAGAPPAMAGPPTPCFDVRVEYVSRVPVALVNNVQYFRWTYRVCGNGCINRGLSHWVLGLCTATQQGLSQISTQSLDDGTNSNYMYTIGKDPTTNVAGLKWDFVSGNSIDNAHECAEFSFVATGEPTTVTWAAKGATIVTTGTVIGPGCGPVPTEQATWGAVKTLFR